MTTTGDVLALLERPGILAVVLVLVVLVVLLVRSSRRTGRPGGRTPRGIAPCAGEIWFADVPFADGTGSKDRPVLVLHVGRRTCEVARFTSQDRSARRDHAAVPPGFPGLARASWIDLRPRELPLAALRRRTGVPGPALVAWYRQVARGPGPSGGAA